MESAESDRHMPERCKPDAIASESRTLSDGVLRVNHAFAQLAPLINADRNCTLLLSGVFSEQQPTILSGTMHGLTTAHEVESIRWYMNADLRQDSLFTTLFSLARDLRRKPVGERVAAVRRSDVWSPTMMPHGCPFGEIRALLRVQQSIYVVGVVQSGWTACHEIVDPPAGVRESSREPEFVLICGLHSSSMAPEFSSKEVSCAETLGRLTVPFIIDHLGPTMPTPHAGEIEVRLSQLSSRQRELLPLLAQGLSEQEIADRMFRSKSTIHTHVRRIYEVLGVRNRVQLVRIVGAAGSLALGRPA